MRDHNTHVLIFKGVCIVVHLKAVQNDSYGVSFGPKFGIFEIELMRMLMKIIRNSGWTS